MALRIEEPREISNKMLFEQGDVEELISGEELSKRILPRHVNADPENVERGLAQLVLTLIELIRQLLERQALKRIEGGSLSDEEIERLGSTLEKLHARMQELKVTFGLKDEDLNLDLGPLGDLL